MAPVTGFALPAPSAAELASHRSAMLRFARRRIRDEDLAEDAVQEALLAALSNRASFQGQSALRTWLIGILNHKIQDTFRREGRYVQVVADGTRGEEGTDDGFDRLAFAQLAAADDPAQRVGNARLLDALLREIDALPATLKDVFVLQVLEGHETAEVCMRLGITEANCWVRLHRARKRLADRMRDHLV
ncbi:MAG: sigma-70 family RNA polymerase sigma factor [Burkholderiaceae bacterium]|nr:sigma-70 family RNA polymerase sigma factor [Burkholderiaceae bacterium]